MGEPNGDRVAAGIARWARERPELDTSGTEIVGRILRLASVFGESLADALAPHGLGMGEYSLLAILRSHGAPEYALAPTELAAATYLTSGGVANLVKRLEGAGLVERRSRPGDGRGVLVRLTDAGRERVDAAVADVAARERQLVSALAARERRGLAGRLADLLAAVDARPRRRA